MHKDLLNQLKKILKINGIFLIATLIFVFFGMFDVPLGFLFGTVIVIIINVIYYFLNKLEEKNKTNPWMIIINILLNVLVVVIIVGSMFLSLLLEHLNIKIFSFISVGFAILLAFIPLIYKKLVGGSK